MRMNIRQIARTSLLAAILSPVAPHLASADVIDGEWCMGTSHFTIDGPSILTPGGNRIQGNYTRHSFAYVVPDNEPGAGSEISMLLFNAPQTIIKCPSDRGKPADTKTPH